MRKKAKQLSLKMKQTKANLDIALKGRRILKKRLSRKLISVTSQSRILKKKLAKKLILIRKLKNHIVKSDEGIKLIDQHVMELEERETNPKWIEARIKKAEATLIAIGVVTDKDSSVKDGPHVNYDKQVESFIYFIDFDIPLLKISVLFSFQIYCYRL